MIKIDDIRIHWVSDTSTSHIGVLGEYTNVPNGRPGTIDRAEVNEDLPEGQLRYWVPAVYEPEYPENAMQDYLRNEALCNGQWEYQVCHARAIVSYDCGTHCRLEILSSSGELGFESDAGPIERLRVEIDQLTDLKAHLLRFGVTWETQHEQILIEREAALINLNLEIARIHD